MRFGGIYNIAKPVYKTLLINFGSYR